MNISEPNPFDIEVLPDTDPRAEGLSLIEIHRAQFNEQIDSVGKEAQGL